MSDPKGCDRRAFLRGALRCTAAAAGAGLIDGLAPLATAAGPPAASPQGPALAVAHGPAPEALVKAAVDGLGGMGRFVGRGDVVVVKPNIAWDRTPEQAANTSPEVVKAVVRMCLESGAKRVLVVDRPCNDPRRCYRQSGIQDAVLSLGDPAAVIEQMDERRFVPVTVRPPGRSPATWLFYRDVLEADRVINVPVPKHHNSTRLTMSLKNVMGVVGGNRGNIHRDLDNIIADLNTAFRSSLIVMDAVRILTAHGPQGGRLQDVRRLDTVVAGTDPVAIDAFAATFFGITGRDVPHVVASARLGLGEIDLDRVAISNVGPG